MGELKDQRGRVTTIGSGASHQYSHCCANAECSVVLDKRRTATSTICTRPSNQAARFGS